MLHSIEPTGRRLAVVAALGVVALLGAAPAQAGVPALTAQFASSAAVIQVADTTTTTTTTAATATPAATTTTAPDPVETRIADLHAKLHITARQEPAWRAVAAQMRGNANRMEELFRERAAHQPTMTAIQDLHSYARIAETRARDVKSFIPVFEKLYNAMPPAQRHNADIVFRADEQRQSPHH